MQFAWLSQSSCSFHRDEPQVAINTTTRGEHEYTGGLGITNSSSASSERKPSTIKAGSPYKTCGQYLRQTLEVAARAPEVATRCKQPAHTRHAGSRGCQCSTTQTRFVRVWCVCVWCACLRVCVCVCVWTNLTPGSPGAAAAAAGYYHSCIRRRYRSITCIIQGVHQNGWQRKLFVNIVLGNNSHAEAHGIFYDGCP